MEDRLPRRQTKSAPPRRERVKRTSAVAEIEEWVFSNKDLVSGKSNEQRLLRARLMELGKDRFKVKTKIAHDLRKFVEKQTKNGLINTRARPVSGVQSVADLETLKSRRTLAAHSAPATRTTPPTMKKSVHFPDGIRKCEYLTTGIMDSADDAFISLNPDCPLKLRTCPERVRPSTAATPLYCPSTQIRSQSQTNVRFIKENKLSKYGGRFPSVVGDPRFSGLHKSLSENYVTNTKDSVNSIIQRIDCMGKPLKGRTKEARRELELKIKHFMEENNIVF